MNELTPETYDPKMMSNGVCELPGYFKLDCRMNVLKMYNSKKSIYLSESQKRLMICLINNIHCKRMIIKIVWHECHQRIRDNNYHQLVYQLRNTLSKNEVPGDLLITIPHRGLVLNKEALDKKEDNFHLINEHSDAGFTAKKDSSIALFFKSIRRVLNLA